MGCIHMCSYLKLRNSTMEVSRQMCYPSYRYDSLLYYVLEFILNIILFLHLSRNVARLVVVYRQVSAKEDAYSFDIIHPSQYDAFIHSVKVMVKHEGIEKVGIPSTLLKIGRSIEVIANAKWNFSIKMLNQEFMGDSEKFLRLHQEEWSIIQHMHGTP